MSNVQLQEYVAQQRAKGVMDAEILKALEQSGWAANDISSALGIAPAPAPVPNPNVVPRPPVVQSQSTPPGNPLGNFKMPAMNAKTTSIITQCVIFNVIGTAISSGGTFLAQFFVGGPLGVLNQYNYQFAAAIGSSYSRFWLMTPGRLISDIFFSIVGGAVLGLAIAFYWNMIHQYAKQYSNGFLNSPFKILFFPTLIAALLSMGMSVAVGFMASFIMFASAVIGRYVFAKGVNGVIQKNFPNPV